MDLESIEGLIFLIQILKKEEWEELKSIIDNKFEEIKKIHNYSKEIKKLKLI